MLSKLYKHEFRASSRYYVPVYIAASMLSLVLAIVWAIDNLWQNEIFSTITSPFVFILFFGALAAISAASFFIPIFRFYKTMVSDEGYLTHTLPVTTDQLILSRLLVAVTYKIFSFLISGVIIVLAVVLTIILTKTYETWEWDMLVRAFNEVLNEMGVEKVSMPLLYTEIFVMCVESLFSGTLVCYVAMAIAQCMKSHKVLWSVVFYVCVNIAISMISSIISTCTMVGYSAKYLTSSAVDDYEMAVFEMYQGSFLISIILSIFVIIGSYFISRFVFSKRLNLE